MDGKHINFQAPRSCGSYYYNYKGFNSIVLLAIVDAHYKFIFVDVGCNGRISDGGVYNNSVLSSLVTQNSLNFPPPAQLPNTNITTPFTFVADDAFPLQSHIMKPYSKRDLSDVHKVFNYRLSRARRVVENAFGIMANRFRVMLTKINLPVEKVQTVTLAACALHNFLIKENTTSYLNATDLQGVSSLTEGEWRNDMTLRSLTKQGGNRSKNSVIEIRNMLCHYFNTVGAVPWQWECIRKFNF